MSVIGSCPVNIHGLMTKKMKWLKNTLIYLDVRRRYATAYANIDVRCCLRGGRRWTHFSISNSDISHLPLALLVSVTEKCAEQVTEQVVQDGDQEMLVELKRIRELEVGHHFKDICQYVSVGCTLLLK